MYKRQTLFDVARQIDVDAIVGRLTRHDAADSIDGKWWGIPVSKTLREQEGDHHWCWRQQVGEKRNRAAWECLAARGPEGDIEGAAIYRVDARSQLDPNEGTVYMDRLAAAPRNRDWLVAPPRYRGVGTALLLAAVQHSYSLGLGGRVWLSCLPDARSQRFYEGKGFCVLSVDEDGMIDYELPADVAEKWLEAEGCI